MSINQIAGGATGGVSVDTRQDVKVAPVVAKAAPASGPVTVEASKTAVSKDSQPQNDISAKELKNSVDQINRAIGLNKSVNLNLDSDSGKVVVQIVDNETNVVLRQIPSREVLAIARDLEGKKGVLLNDHA
ncbi:flagellar protein FlaG [Undibacterium sp. Ji42W]|uniref:flagellar protein FlaG n=1 Tax=Undibacterium sp. Ji42W TaxID=3413039 RepID=UPI003BF33A51